ncbi:MAG: ATP-binding protein [Ruminococcus sp.]|nr:ATP-binding protein [Ruminococcus sp.]
MENIQITSEGIQKNLRRVKPYDAICEYIWNGFDAGASVIEIEYKVNELDGINFLSVKDNGSGISHKDLPYKFKPFNNSEKYQSREENLHHSIPHGKNGVGRLTFFSFATDAEWKTVYSDDSGKNKGYSIYMNSSCLHEYNPNDEKEPADTDEQTGTIVSFNNVFGINSEELVQTIKDKFFWFICIYSYKHYAIRINGESVDFSSKKKAEFPIDVSNEADVKHNFEITAILWNDSLGLEYSKYYFINSNGEEVYKENTTLNKKSDEFWHSVIIKSDYFDDFSFKSCDEGQMSFTAGKNDTEYKALLEVINTLLIKKRREYLKAASEAYIEKLVSEEAYPTFDDSDFLDKYRKEQLDSIVSSLYQAEPKIFTSLNISQKKIFIRLINTIMNSSDKESLFKVIEEVVELDENERKDLADLLGKMTLANILSAIKLIEDRIRVVQALKQIVFNKEFNAYEVQHVQAIVEKHYWLFGEQYHLLTSAEPDFNEALRRLLFAKTGNAESVTVDHEDVNKEMDIFMNKQSRTSGYFENVVVELKRPSVSIGEKQLSQIKKYMRVIQSDDRFNSSDSKWVYYLIGNHFTTDNYIQGELETNKHHGESGLVFSAANHKIYVKTWAEIFEDFEVKSEYLLQRLKFDKQLWLEKHNSADDAVSKVTDNSACLTELLVPQK